MKFGKQLISLIFLPSQFAFHAFRLLSKLLLENSYQQLRSSQRISQDYHLNQPHVLEKALQPFRTVQTPNIGSKSLVSLSIFQLILLEQIINRELSFKFATVQQRKSVSIGADGLQ